MIDPRFPSDGQVAVSVGETITVESREENSRFIVPTRQGGRVEQAGTGGLVRGSVNTFSPDNGT